MSNRFIFRTACCAHTCSATKQLAWFIINKNLSASPNLRTVNCRHVGTRELRGRYKSCRVERFLSLSWLQHKRCSHGSCCTIFKACVRRTETPIRFSRPVRNVQQHALPSLPATPYSRHLLWSCQSLCHHKNSACGKIETWAQLHIQPGARGCQTGEASHSGACTQATAHLLCSCNTGTPKGCAAEPSC